MRYEFTQPFIVDNTKAQSRLGIDPTPLDDAIAHIRAHGTRLAETIVTNDLAAARRFTREVDAAAVLVNASTRLVDGNQFGLGAEMGISTSRVHARGPVGVRELTTTKFVVWGDGHIRE